ADAHRVMVLENIVDHTNVGAIFRSAAALGVDAVLITPRCADPLYRRAIRVSMGTVFQVPWTRIDPWPGSVELLRALGFEVAALALTDDSVPLDDYAASAPDRVALVLGPEGDGLSRRTLHTVDRALRIPMSGGVDSPHGSAAASTAGLGGATARCCDAAESLAGGGESRRTGAGDNTAHVVDAGHGVAEGEDVNLRREGAESVRMR